MKFPLSWLRDHLETNADLVEITDKLTSLGLEVENVNDPGEELKNFVVGIIVEAVPHPNADRLKICRVNTGGEIVQVVCGAPNARNGIKGVFAPSGVTIPGTGAELKKTKIRGIESNGMLCSELELTLSDQHEGIIELPADSIIGENVSKILGLDDPIIDIAITPNRADCLGVAGIARDLAASGLGRVCTPIIEKVEGSFRSPIRVKLDLPEKQSKACPLFITRYIRGVKNKQSPEWLQKRLMAIGLRPISAIVDITNYITFDRNRPTHAFDADRLKGNELSVRIMSGTQSFDALNEKSYKLEDEMTVIQDSGGVVSLAGVIGGEKTGCIESTENILLEIAIFDPVRTATTGRKLGIDSDARYRFERGVDPAFAMDGMELATKMVLEFCGGVASEINVVGSEPIWEREISYNPQKIYSLGGLKLKNSDNFAILNALGFEYKQKEKGFVVVPPSWRADVEGEADLVEEVLRVYGYEKIPTISLPRSKVNIVAKLPLMEKRVSRARRALASRGLLETLTYSFMSKAIASKFGGVSDELVLANPISAELDAMRPSILPNLIESYKRNSDRGYTDIGFFEIGPQFEGDAPEAQRYVASGIRGGNFEARHWQGDLRKVDTFDAKADSVAALEAAGAPVNKIQISQSSPEWYHPGRSGEFRLGSKILGFFGEIHPTILSDFDLQGPLVGFEAFIDSIPAPRAKSGTTRPALNASDYQAVERDFAFIIKEEIPAQEVIRATRGVEKDLITDVMVFDLYSGPGIETGFKSIGITIRLQPKDKTFLDEDIDSVVKKIVDNVHRHTGGILRT